MSEPLSNIPRGMRYYCGTEARLRREVEDTAMSVFDGWSYEEITTPSVDYYALFEHGMGRQQAELAFKFTDTDGRLLALRPDVTSSVARAAATLFAGRERPLRLCYAAPVFRQKGQSHAEWRRESTHIGCELIGADGIEADMEVVAIAVEVLQRLELAQHDYCITLNDVEIFNGVAERLALDDSARERMRRLVDSRDAAELQNFLAPHASTDERAGFARLIQLSGKQETLAEARRLITNPRSVAALNRLEELWRVIESLDLTDYFEIDFGDVSGLDYYTGLTFKIYLSGAGTRVGGGGRYDKLTSNFGRPEPAIGFVFDLDALTDVLARSNTSVAMREQDGTVAPLSNDDPATLFFEATAMRAKRERVLIKSGEAVQCRN
ncbi:MAG: ATP phosphoribosyltransferase regulatory subunit [Pyrinomonadaceae bacterium]|nr:ATP phosphoribosyltransferase regulatory subunit [Pyrinomonadaceae bacterium]